MSALRAKVWYLAHSGFAIQTENSVLIFDYYLDEPKGGIITQGVIEPAVLAEQNVIVLFHTITMTISIPLYSIGRKRFLISGMFCQMIFLQPQMRS